MVWIGGIESLSNGSFTWMDGQLWTAFSESLWAPGQPNDNRGETICTEYFGRGVAHLDVISNTVKKGWHYLGTSLQNFDVGMISI